MGDSNKSHFNKVVSFQTVLFEGFHPDFLKYTAEQDLPECLWTITVDKDGNPQSYFGRPSVVATSLDTGEEMFKAWHEKGKLHRKPDLPAMIITSYKYENSYWFRHGVLHRDESRGAAEIEIALKTGILVKEIYHNNGQLSRRTDGPYSVYRDETTGEILDIDYHDDRRPDDDMDNPNLDA